MQLSVDLQGSASATTTCRPGAPTSHRPGYIPAASRLRPVTPAIGWQQCHANRWHTVCGTYCTGSKRCHTERVHVTHVQTWGQKSARTFSRRSYNTSLRIHATCWQLLPHIKLGHPKRSPPGWHTAPPRDCTSSCARCRRWFALMVSQDSCWFLATSSAHKPSMSSLNLQDRHAQQQQHPSEAARPTRCSCAWRMQFEHHDYARHCFDSIAEHSMLRRDYLRCQHGFLAAYCLPAQSLCLHHAATAAAPSCA